jgi:hypothetical protein
MIDGLKLLTEGFIGTLSLFLVGLEPAGGSTIGPRWGQVETTLANSAMDDHASELKTATFLSRFP